MLGRVGSQHDLPRAHEETPSLDTMYTRKVDIAALSGSDSTHAWPPPLDSARS